MRQVVSKVQSAFPFDIDNAQVAPEILRQSRPRPFVIENIVHAFYVLNARMSRYCLGRGNAKQAQKVAK